MTIEMNDLEDEVLPGSERVRSKYRSDSYPVMLAEIVDSAMPGGRREFPFRSWARSAGFTYPESATEFLCHVGSAAEAFFAREFVRRPGVTFDGAIAYWGDVSVALQKPVGRFYLDFLVTRRNYQLAIEIDGMAHHGTTWQQMQRDYRRQRSLVLRD